LLTGIAHDLNVAVDVPAHVHKGKITAGDADARRGASAQTNADRLDYTLTVMDEKEAEGFGIEEEGRKRYVRLDSAKVNIARPMQASWFRLVSVNLGNADHVYIKGDDVQAIEVWEPPETWEGTDNKLVNTILDDIAKGMADGRRYSNHGAAKDRQVWKVVKSHCPTKGEAQCKEMVHQWMKTKVLFEDDYMNPIRRKKEKGLFVDDSKRPNS
jgi:hypothetical protein